MTALLDLDDALRCALHSAVDPLIPAGDGLSVIRRRNANPTLTDRFHRAFAVVLPAHRARGDHRV